MFESLSELGPLPYFTIGPWEIGSLKIHSFGLMVAFGVLFGHTTVMHRVKKLGYDEDAARSLYMYAFICGFVFAHVFNILLYHPGDLLTNPGVLLEINGSLSSYGGFFGGLIGLLIWRKFHPTVDPAPLVNCAFFSLPVGWFFGRLGCSFVHDHPGALTDFFLAVDFGANPPGGVRHDLGLYEFIWWTLILIGFFALDRWKGDVLNKPHGFWAPMLMICYTPARFFLDFFRVPPELGGDVRYIGLTPAQFFSLTGFIVGIVLMKRWNDRRKSQPAEEPSEPRRAPPKPGQPRPKAKKKPAPEAQKPSNPKPDAARPEPKEPAPEPQPESKEPAAPATLDEPEEVEAVEDPDASDQEPKETKESKEAEEKPAIKAKSPQTTPRSKTKPKPKKKNKKKRR